MKVKDFDVKKALLDSAREEFLSHGFANTSIRNICRKANLTTGAFYSNFSRKEDLFRELVDETVQEFYRMYDKVVERELSDISTSEENEVQSIAFIRKNKDEFRLLFDCSSGTEYEGFKDKLINDLFARTYQQFFDQYAETEVNDSLVKIILKMKFTEYMELVYGSYEEDEVIQLVRALTMYTEGGFQSLIRHIKIKESDKGRKSKGISSNSQKKARN